MCGIAGLWSSDSGRSRAEMAMTAHNMNAALVHRGPDAGALWQDADAPLALAQRRLSIIDVSPLSAQPMASPSGRYVITYNGEFYNFPALQKELEARGAVFKGRSDTEIFLTAIEHWGLATALQKVIGMYAFALWDRHERTLHCARDRMGKKPLYIGWAGRDLVLASELKALRAHPDFKADINPASADTMLRRGWLQAPHCIYTNVWMLKPGHGLTLDTKALDVGADLAALMRPTWSATETAQHAKTMMLNGSDTAMVDECESLLSRCVSDRMISDVPLGAFLSGGIDSSSVVALMQTQSTRAVKTFTIGFETHGFDEATAARRIAQHLGTDHHEHVLTSTEVLNIIPRLPDMFDEPFADISAIPTFLVSHFAKKTVSVALSGDGGDEVLGGYERHINAPRIWNHMRPIPAFMRAPLARLIAHIPVDAWDKTFSARPQFGTKMHKLADILPCRSPEDIYARLLHTAPEDVPRLFEALGFAERLMLWDTLLYLPGDVLTKVDRASMAASLEARAPLLDTRLFEFAWRLPPHMKIRGGQGKFILREVLARHVPRGMFERPKQGFTMPVGLWLKGPLKHWAQDLLHAPCPHGNTQHTLNLWQQHLDGRGNHTQALWNVLMFKAWYRRWMGAP